MGIVMVLMCAVAGGQADDSRPACGSIVHVFPDGEDLPDPGLGTLPVTLQREVEKTIRPLLAKEARTTGADADGSKIDDVKDSLRMHRITRDEKGKELYAAWWNIPSICGHHGNCPIWLLEVDSDQVRNLGPTSEPDIPAATIGTGWGIGVLPLTAHGERLMTVAAGFAAPGQPDAEAVCWKRRGDTYVSDPCPTACRKDLNRNNQ